MGIYLFNRDVLIKLLNTPPLATDFGKEIFPRSICTHHVQAHVFDGYWEDLGTVKSYHEANLALVSDQPPFDFHSPDGVIYTRMRFLHWRNTNQCASILGLPGAGSMYLRAQLAPLRRGGVWMR